MRADPRTRLSADKISRPSSSRVERLPYRRVPNAIYREKGKIKPDRLTSLTVNTQPRSSTRHEQLWRGKNILNHSGHLLAQVTRPKHVASRSSKKVVLIGLASNVAIAICKFIAASVTHSSAMFAEALHSTADTGNELLLLIGIRRSARPPDALHPFGHGKALYLYSLLVAVCIFGIGGGLSCYRGISQLFSQELPTHLGWNYTVQALAAAFDFYSWRVAYRTSGTKRSPVRLHGMKSLEAKPRPYLPFFLRIRQA